MKDAVHDDSCDLLGSFFATLAHATRMRIFCALQHEPRSVSDIAEYAGISITNASQHLRLMRDRGAVSAERQAQHVYYRIADQRFIEAASLIRRALSDHMSKEAEKALAGTARRKSTKVAQAA